MAMQIQLPIGQRYLLLGCNTAGETRCTMLFISAPHKHDSNWTSRHLLWWILRMMILNKVTWSHSCKSHSC